jgi:hypothetical protein
MGTFLTQGHDNVEVHKAMVNADKLPSTKMIRIQTRLGYQ